MSSMVPALEYERNTTNRATRPENFAMGLVCSQHCPCFSCLIPPQHSQAGTYCPHITCKAQMVKVLCSRLHSKRWAQDRNPELTTSTPRLCRCPRHPHPHGRLSIRRAILNYRGCSPKQGCCTLAPPLLNQPPRNQSWRSWRVLLAKILSVPLRLYLQLPGETNGSKSYIRNIIVCMHVSIML